MQFALLGNCNSSIGLIRAVMSSRDHELVSICGISTGLDNLARQFPDIPTSKDWESLLAGGQVDAVIVAGDTRSETRNDQLRKLAQAGLSLILVHPACDAMVAYELEMIGAESGCRLFAYVPGMRHRAVAQAIDIVGQRDAAAIGAVEQIVVEHFLEERSSEKVLSGLARDASLFSPMIGRVGEVNAFGPKHGEENYSALSVNMTGTGKIPLRWSVVPAEGKQGSVATLVGTRGRQVLSMLGDPPSWSLQPSQVSDDSSEHSVDDASLALVEFERTLGGEVEPDLSWSDACRTLELETAVRDSLRRGRKIQLYDDQYSEQQTFKGKMAVGGCSLLMLALVILFGFAIFDVVAMPFRQRPVSANGPSEPTTSIWLRLWPAYPLLIFLVLQLLKLVFMTDRGTPANSSQS